MAQRKKEYARLPIAEKLATATRLRDVQETLAPIRAANKANRFQRKVNIPVTPDQD
jgi:hypothetical protein